MAALQYFVYRQLRRYIRLNFPEKAAKWIAISKWVFLIMNIPVALVYFRRQIAPDATTVTNIILYPYTVWVFLLIFWTIILIPIVAVRILRTNVFKKAAVR